MILVVLLFGICHEDSFAQNDTTTAEPSTLTTAVPTSTAGPEGHVGHWNTSCIKLDAEIKLVFKYNTSENNELETKVAVPTSAIVSGNCTEDYDSIIFSFFGNWSLLLSFNRNSSVSSDVFMNEVVIKYFTSEKNFPNITSDLVNRLITVSGPSDPHTWNLHIKKDRSYECNAEYSYKVTSDCSLALSHLRVQAFMTKAEFDYPDVCLADTMTSDIVPIVIGAALAILVVVVLIAYLIGRVRTRRTTYENIES
ncbi:unnamed protein product [Soboliphyme baturini]|uniref:Lysosome-associated membrane glycoprotein 5 n=1 Tax=Soboliphyme baturini TaxID=241478 RepID=A0A183J6T8_9BILA|nr:unnamed protein product [Soboliphyme baturini]